jgi:LysM repeat protein
MKKKLYFLSILFSLIFFQSHAEISKDSIGIEKKDNQFFILHKISPRENLTSIAQHYKVSIQDVLKANPAVSADKIVVGKVLRIPMKAQGKLASNANSTSQGKVRKIYTVRAGETLFRIARRFEVSPEEIKKLNNLKNQELNEGQKLTIEMSNSLFQQNAKELNEVGANAFKPVVAVKEKYRYHIVKEGESLYKIAALYNQKVDSLKKWNQLKRDNLLNINQKIIVGTNEVSPSADDAKKSGSKLVYEAGKGEMINSRTDEKFALHRTAPLYSYIFVANPSKGTSVRVQVIGSIPNVDRDKDVIIKISKASCDALGIINDRFPVELLYEKPKE